MVFFWGEVKAGELCPGQTLGILRFPSPYLDKDRGYIEDKAKEAFVDGLLFNLRFHVKGDSPQTFQDAFNYAIKYEALLSEAAKANTTVPQGLSVMPATPPAMSHVRSQEPRPPRISDACYECGLEGHYAIDCRQRQQRFRGNSSRNSASHYPWNDHVDYHRIEKPQGGKRDVQAVSPSENALVEQLRTELRVSQNQRCYWLPSPVPPKDSVMNSSESKTSKAPEAGQPITFHCKAAQLQTECEGRKEIGQMKRADRRRSCTSHPRGSSFHRPTPQ
ncbi:hypothetical protein B9Z55_015714 [Caenorhabditis nigoni]|uniref:CCHC-type domain-containing protein n=1 Tax=Caenorhabditis nigoni TaxID=1611254 RepID=A0A2G5UBF5_9PELO|nr:hypothetical protein B9Z55_015714 [Caenorhabditis nigoni]